MFVALVFEREAETFDIQNFTTTITVHENQKYHNCLYATRMRNEYEEVSQK